jgi:hypothetical protein
MIGRLRCLFGRHDWWHVTFVYGSWDECDRCGKRR